MSVSIVIPTYNRCATLLDCLAALDQQTFDKASIEIIVVDDGSSDETAARVTALLDRGGARLKYVHQTNRGPAAARNLGVSNSSGELLLFLGDDIIATPQFVEQHVQGHAANPAREVAILGKTVWSPSLHVTPLMHWLEDSGMQFDYGALDRGKQPAALHFYTSNISLKLPFFLQHGGFDEDFPHAAYEDIELALRMEKGGLRIIYRPEALAYHDHATTFESYRKRIIKVGMSAYILNRKHPGFIKQAGLLRTFAKRVILLFTPLVMLAGSERMKLWMFVVETRQLYWQAFDQQAACGPELAASYRSRERDGESN